MFTIKLVSSASGSHTSSNAKANNVSQKKSHVLTVIIATLLALIALAAGGLIWAGFTASGSDRIFPNVTVAGQDVGGLTISEASQQLASAGIGGSNNKRLIVNLPLSVRINIDTSTACTCISSDDISASAFSYGRESGFMVNAFHYLLIPHLSLIRSSFDSGVYINEDYVRGIISEAIKQLNADFQKNSCVITEKEIKIIKGSSDILVTEAAVYAVVHEALIKQDFSQIDYEPVSTGTDSADLQKIYDTVSVAPADAAYDTKAHEITREVVGISFDLDAAKKALKGAKYGEIITIPKILKVPSVTYEQLSKIYFVDVLSELTTNLAQIANRNNNVKLAVKSINGTVINPGEIFNYNTVLGERTSARGYLEASAYRGGEVVQEIGGGICQVSSMVYYCSLYANLEIVSRTNHRWIPSYITPGLDATVSWGGPDFIFKNSTDYPIRIDATIDMDATYPANLTVKFVGTNSSKRNVKMEYYTTDIIPLSTNYEEDSAVEPGGYNVKTTGWDGCVVETYRSVYAADGSLLSRTFESRNIYSPMNRVVLVPPGVLDENGEPIYAIPDP